MRCFAFSDTHTMHEQIIIPDGVDMLIFGGDCSNKRNNAINTNEVALFLNWFSFQKAKYKIMVAGNHDGSIQARMINPKDFGITYLEHESVEIEGIKIFGSPYTPTWGDWSFQKARHNMHDLWQEMPAEVDILVTHGPPAYVLDLYQDIDSGNFIQVGDVALGKRVNIVEPKYHIFGHVHNHKYIKNQGTKTIANKPTIYANVSCVEDGKFHKGLISNGYLFEI